jgi:virulence factor Mce-like protein
VSPLIRRLVAPVVVLAVVIAAIVVLVGDRGHHEKHLTAYFSRTVSLYRGAQVKILGVTVGKVTSIKVSGDQVAVKIDYDAKYSLPTDVQAEIVPPSIVGDRYVQLSPAFDQTKDRALPANWTLSSKQTQVPVEVDQIYSSLNQLSKSLGPSGANSKGALSDLLTVLASNLNGNGSALHQSVHGLSQAIATLAESRGNIDGSVKHLNAISTTLAADDPQVRTLAQLLAKVSTELNHQDSSLAGATTSLNAAFHDVARFVAQNRGVLTTDVSDLDDVASTIASRKQAVATALDLAPLGLTDLWDSFVSENYDLKHPTGHNINGLDTALTARSNLLANLGTQLGSDLSVLCAELPSAQATQIKPLCTALASAGNNLGTILSGILSTSNSANSVPGRSLSGLLAEATK